MSDQHLAPTCPHCGRQKCRVVGEIPGHRASFCCWPDGDFERNGAHATDREDYLTEECAKLDEDRDWWKRQAIDYKAELQRRAEEEDKRRAECQGDQPCAGELAYQVELKRARKWRKRAREWRRRHDMACSEIRTFQDSRDRAKRERDEARAALDAMTERTRGLWDELLGAAMTLRGCGLDEWARLASDAAGEPIS